jgi:DNA-binding transcriptional MerR regulator
LSKLNRAIVNQEASYTLDALAAAFDLTPRTARHYVENVLPARHKTGRGRKARYGRDTWNCFAFIRKARRDGLSLAQVAGLLHELDQPRIDRVANGLEQLAIVPAARAEPPKLFSSPCMADEFPEMHGERPATATPRWQLLFLDDTLQIAHKGQASPRQREQVRMAAAYIKRILSTGD